MWNKFYLSTTAIKFFHNYWFYSCGVFFVSLIEGKIQLWKKIYEYSTNFQKKTLKIIESKSEIEYKIRIFRRIFNSVFNLIFSLIFHSMWLFWLWHRYVGDTYCLNDLSPIHNSVFSVIVALLIDRFDIRPFRKSSRYTLPRIKAAKTPTNIVNARIHIDHTSLFLVWIQNFVILQLRPFFIETASGQWHIIEMYKGHIIEMYKGSRKILFEW